MPHIDSPPLPGIVGLMAFRPETAVPLNALTQRLLRGESSLTSGERELIAARVSRENECFFCENAHAATANVLLDGNRELVDDVLDNGSNAKIDARMQALLAIADRVVDEALTVTPELIAAARAAGADDIAIHDTVLVAAAFCMFNKYVDGLAAITPREPEAYAPIGELLASVGYVGALAAQGV